MCSMTGHWEPVGSCSPPGVLSNRKKNLNCFSFLFHYSDQQLFLLQNISFGLGKSTLSKYLAKHRFHYFLYPVVHRERTQTNALVHLGSL